MNALGAPHIESRLRPPPGAARVPRFDEGWLTEDGSRRAFLSYVAVEHSGTAAESLERIHEEITRTHCFDVWTRRAMLARLGALPPDATVIDIGCASGFLLEDLHRSAPHMTLIGLDLLGSGLRKAHAAIPRALLLQADARALPLADASVDGVTSANLLEHVPDDERVLAEISRILRPGGRAVIVVPLGPSIYDYYDRFVGHERRYARGELARKAGAAGLRVLEDICLGALLYPAFRAVKLRNRYLYGHLRGEALARRATRDAERTEDSAIGHLACRVEGMLLRRGVRLPFGIRGLAVLERRPVDPVSVAATRDVDGRP
jgi:SAM-dependent methyltransferase